MPTIKCVKTGDALLAFVSDWLECLRSSSFTAVQTPGDTQLKEAKVEISCFVRAVKAHLVFAPLGFPRLEMMETEMMRGRKCKAVDDLL